jgi:hypothetical protein
MIGKSLRERFELGRLDDARAQAVLERALAATAKPLVEVRAESAEMIACLVVDADKRAVRLCRDLGFELRLGATTVFGLRGADAATLFPALEEPERAWLREPCGPRETKVLLVAGGIALLSLTLEDGKVTVRAVP